MARQTDSFEIETQDGSRFRVYEYTETVPAETLGNPGATVEGLKNLRTSEGHHVNRTGENDFEIVELGAKAWRR